MKSLYGCTALITGASAGIGTEFARQLAPDAQTLILVARRIERLEALRDELVSEYPELKVFPYALDLADEACTEDFLRWLKENNLRVDFLVNNAGLGDHGDFATSDWPRIKAMLDVNIGALTRLTHRLLPSLLECEEAAILNVSSIAGFLPLPQAAVYAATKAYVTSFSEALRAELRRTNVSVTTLCPGPVETEFGAVATRPDSNDRMTAPEILKVSREQVVSEALAAVENDRARVVPGLLIALLAAVACMMPMFLLRFLFNRRR